MARGPDEEGSGPQGRAAGDRVVMRCLLQPTLVVGLLAMVAAAAGPGTPVETASAPGVGPVAVIRLVVDEGRTASIKVPGRIEPEGLRFKGTHRLGETGLAIAYDWLADLDPRGGATCKGRFQVSNEGDADRRLMLEVRFPLDPLIVEEARLGGSVDVRLTLDEGGGKVEIPSGEALWTVLVDGRPVRALHPGPFVMGGARRGESRVDGSFGAPYPSFVTSPITDGVGMRHQLGLTEGESIRFDCDLHVVGAPENFVRRRSTEPVRIGASEERLRIDVGRRAGPRNRGSVSRSRGSRESGGGTRIDLD